MLDPGISLGIAMMKGHQLNSTTEKIEGPLVSVCVCWVLKIVFSVSSSLLQPGTPPLLSYRPKKRALHSSLQNSLSEGVSVLLSLRDFGRQIDATASAS